MIKKSLRIGEKLWVHFEGRTFLIETSSSVQRYHHKGETSGLITSPMPGKILKISVKTSDQVEIGQTVCIIEAMKMEYSLKAPFKGMIKQIWKSLGQQVALGEKILEIQGED